MLAAARVTDGRDMVDVDAEPQAGKAEVAGSHRYRTAARLDRLAACQLGGKVIGGIGRES